MKCHIFDLSFGATFTEISRFFVSKQAKIGCSSNIMYRIHQKNLFNDFGKPSAFFIRYIGIVGWQMTPCKTGKKIGSDYCAAQAKCATYSKLLLQLFRI